MTGTPPPSAKARWFKAGMILGLGLAVVPMVIALLGIGRAAYGVDEGLRGATHREDKKDEVRFAVSSTSLAAILAPIGVLLGVSCGLGWAGEQRKRR